MHLFNSFSPLELTLTRPLIPPALFEIRSGDACRSPLFPIGYHREDTDDDRGRREGVIYWKYLHRARRDENTRKVSRTSYARSAFIRILSSQECVVYIEPRYASSKPRRLFLFGNDAGEKCWRNAKFPQPFRPLIISEDIKI